MRVIACVHSEVLHPHYNCAQTLRVLHESHASSAQIRRTLQNLNIALPRMDARFLLNLRARIAYAVVRYTINASTLSRVAPAAHLTPSRVRMRHSEREDWSSGTLLL